MKYLKLLDDFLDEVKEDYPYISGKEIRDICSKVVDIIYENKDLDEYEIIDLIIKDDLDFMNELFSNNVVPGYTIGINEGDINIKYFGGKIDDKSSMTENTLFDIASMTKMYTQVILYNLMKEGYFNLDDKIYDLDHRFVNLKDVTVRELMSFTIDLTTPGNMTFMKDIDEAREALFNIKVKVDNNGNEVRGKYVYTDFGLMVMSEVATKLTGKSYKELLSELGLDETRVDELDKFVITGSANQSLLAVNDPKAISLGGYSGHAGIFASSDDILKFYKMTQDGTLLDGVGLRWANMPNELAKNRGKLFGNTFVLTEDGLKSSFVDNLSPLGSYSTQGSTRTQGVSSKTGGSVILTNPASLSLESALAFEEEFNRKRTSKGLNELPIVKEFRFNRDGLEQIYHMIDARRMIDLDNVTRMNARTNLRLRFLNNYFKEMGNEKKIDVIYDMNGGEKHGKRRF